MASATPSPSGTWSAPAPGGRGSPGGARSDPRALGTGEVWALVALASVLAVTVLWWLFALWPVETGVAPALERARLVCFGTDPDTGLPDFTGWALLVGQPIIMVSFLMVVWGGTVRRALGRLARRDGGRVALAGAVTLVLVGLTLTGVRVSSATAAAPNWDAPGALDESVVASVRPRLDQPAPALELVSHRGGTFSLDELAGHPTLVTFAYGHCATICPLVVRNALEAARSSDRNPAVVVVTLDPWRDTPSRLPRIAADWELDEDDRWLLGGDPETVEAALDAWNVARDRDLRTGEITHPALTYVLDEEGRIAFASRGAAETLLALLERL